MEVKPHTVARAFSQSSSQVEAWTEREPARERNTDARSNSGPSFLCPSERSRYNPSCGQALKSPAKLPGNAFLQILVSVSHAQTGMRHRVPEACLSIHSSFVRDCSGSCGSTFSVNMSSSCGMASPVGVEPTTPGLEGRCSIQLSYGDTTGAPYPK